MDTISEETFRGYLSEFEKKYASGTGVNSQKYPLLTNIEGSYILEIPASNEKLENIEYYKKIAEEYNVTLRFTEEPTN